MSDPSQFTEMEWIRFLDIEPLSAEGGRAVIRLRPKPAHLNHNGTVNAPILFGLAEVADRPRSSPECFKKQRQATPW